MTKPPLVVLILLWCSSITGSYLKITARYYHAKQNINKILLDLGRKNKLLRMYNTSKSWYFHDNDTTTLLLEELASVTSLDRMPFHPYLIRPFLYQRRNHKHLTSGFPRLNRANQRVLSGIRNLDTRDPAWGG